MKSYSQLLYLPIIVFGGINSWNAPVRLDAAIDPTVAHAERLAAPDNIIAPPANDNFANAQGISGVNGMTTGTNVEATGETSEPNHASSSFPLNSIWYLWTAPANLSMRFSTVGSQLSTVTMAVYTGPAVNALSAVNTNAISPGILRNSVIFNASAGTAYYIAIDGLDTTVGGINLSWGINRTSNSGQFNFDGDSFSDYSVYRPDAGTWFIRQSSSGTLRAQQWGLSTDVLVPADYDGDGKTDTAIWRPLQSTFYILRSSNSTVLARQWGISSDIPVQGDFDGNEIADLNVWRPSNGTFYVLRNNGQLIVQNWGINTDVPATGDYDGDGKSDFAVRRTNGGSAGTFYVLLSSSGSLLAMPWGVGTDLVAPGDFDGDGKSDFGVYRESTHTYYVLRSSDGSQLARQWGTSGDLASPADYDGDGRTDFSVWRSIDGTFYTLSSITSTMIVRQWGVLGDRPVANSYVR